MIIKRVSLFIFARHSLLQKEVTFHSFIPLDFRRFIKSYVTNTYQTNIPTSYLLVEVVRNVCVIVKLKRSLQPRFLREPYTLTYEECIVL